MTTVNVPNNITAGTAISAAPVQENFQYLEGIINDDVIHTDGSKAFTGIPSGPATDPTSANQFARKKYVDDRAGRVLARRQHATTSGYAVGGAGPTNLGLSVINFVMPTLGATQFLKFSFFIPKITLAADGDGWPTEGTAMGVSMRASTALTTNLVYGQAVTMSTLGFTSHHSLYASRLYNPAEAAAIGSPGATIGVLVYGEQGAAAGQFQLRGEAGSPCEFVVEVV